MTKRHPKMNVKWTFHETMQVVTQRNAGESFVDIAAGLGRTPAACSAKFFEVKKKQPHLFHLEPVTPDVPETPEPVVPEVVAPDVPVAVSGHPFAGLVAAFAVGTCAGALLVALGIVIGGA